MTFLDNIKFMPKLMGSFLVVVILLGIVAFVGYSSIGTVNNGIDEVYSGAMKPSIAIDDTQWPCTRSGVMYTGTCCFPISGRQRKLQCRKILLISMQLGRL